jgi:aromatic aminotransferase
MEGRASSAGVRAEAADGNEIVCSGRGSDTRARARPSSHSLLFSFDGKAHTREGTARAPPTRTHTAGMRAASRVRHGVGELARARTTAAAGGPPPPARSPLPPPSALPLPHLSARVLATDDPVIVATKAMIASSGRAGDVLSLAQGVVHWAPPARALAAATAALERDPRAACAYGPAAGLPGLVDALGAKVAARNGLGAHEVMVTAGANQGFYNVCLSRRDGEIFCSFLGSTAPCFRLSFSSFILTGPKKKEGKKLPDRPFSSTTTKKGSTHHPSQALTPNHAPPKHLISLSLSHTQIVLATLDAGDRAAVFAPFYFNSVSTLVSAGCLPGPGGPLDPTGRLAVGPCDPVTWTPDIEWLEDQLSGPDPPRLVVIVSPSNPTGAVVPPADLERAADACARAGAWLVLDQTYEDFRFADDEEEGGQEAAVVASGNPRVPPPTLNLPPALAAPHVIHLFSFSKAYGMMGWRVGYIAYHASSGLGRQLLKVQDTIPICPPSLSQLVAAAALEGGSTGMEGGPAWVAERVAGLAPNRAAVADALSPLAAAGGSVGRGTGAIYHWAALPPGPLTGGGSGGGGGSGRGRPGSPADDAALVAWLVREHGVCVIPGSACGAPGHIRAAFGNLGLEDCVRAAARLKAGLEEAVGGRGVSEGWFGA